MQACFFGFVMNLASFNLLPTDNFYNAYFDMQQNDPRALNKNFNDLGYSSIYFLQNMGTLMIGFISILCLFAVVLILKVFDRFTNKLRRIQSKLSTYLFWGYPIEVIFESYSVTCMCCLINTTYVSFVTITLFRLLLRQSEKC